MRYSSAYSFFFRFSSLLRSASLSFCFFSSSYLFFFSTNCFSLSSALLFFSLSCCYFFSTIGLLYIINNFITCTCHNTTHRLGYLHLSSLNISSEMIQGNGHNRGGLHHLYKCCSGLYFKLQTFFLRCNLAWRIQVKFQNLLQTQNFFPFELSKSFVHQSNPFHSYLTHL